MAIPRKHGGSLVTETQASTDDGKTQRFLDAEEAAQRLLVGLQRLDEQSKKYSAAAIELSGAADATKELTAAVTEVATAAKDALEVVASVGGPEVLRQVEATGTTLQAVQQRADTTASTVQAVQRATDTAGTTLEAVKGTVETTSAALPAVQAAADATLAVAVASELKIKATAERIEALGRRVDLVLYVAGAAAVLSLVSLVLNLVR